MELVQAVTNYAYEQLESPPLFELSEEQVTSLVDELEAYHAIYSPYFSREEQRENAYAYLRGLLEPTIARKSGENLPMSIRS